MDNFEVIGIDNDGNLICRDLGSGETYNCGENASDFGLSYLTPTELLALAMVVKANPPSDDEGDEDDDSGDEDDDSGWA